MKKRRSALLTVAAILTLLAAFGAMHRLEQKNKSAQEQIEQTQADAEAALQALYRSGNDAESEAAGESKTNGKSAGSEEAEAGGAFGSAEEAETGGESGSSEEAEAGGAFGSVGKTEAETEAPGGTEAESAASALLSEDVDIPAVWVGDSRTVGMRRALGGDSGDIFIAASGEGYEWFAETGEPQLETVLAENPDCPVIFNLGVNDDENLDNYLRIYRSLQQEYPDTVFWFLSVNPIDPERCSAITNEEIEYFNEKLEEAFPGQYLDSYSLMDGTETTDGIHYSEEQYRRIYVFVKETIAAQTQETLTAQARETAAAQTQEIPAVQAQETAAAQTQEIPAAQARETAAAQTQEIPAVQAQETLAAQTQ